MALSFPNSPSVGDIYVDSGSGFSYQWSGELWKSYKVEISDSLGGNLDADLSLNSNDITGTGDVDITGNLKISGIATAPSFVGSLTGTASNATQLNSQAASYYLDYDNFSNKPTIPTNNNQLTNGAGFITTSFTNTNQLTNGAGFITASDDITGTSGGLTGSPNITVTDITASGDITVGGTLTYEDVNNVDSVGLITARTGVRVPAGGIEVSNGGLSVTGVTTVTGNISVSGTVDGRDVATDGSKLDGIASGAEVNVATNLSVSTTTTTNVIASSTGTNATLNEATSSDAGLMSTTHHDKLDGIEANATADQTASEILTAIKTVDGASSGLDADVLDGQEGTYYLNYNNFTNTPSIPSIPDIASQAEAEAGTNNTKMMTPLRVKQAIDALGGSVIQSIQRGTFSPTSGTSNSVTITSVNTSKTMVNFLGITASTSQALDSSAPQYYFHHIQLASSTSLTFTRTSGTTAASYNNSSVSYEVIEFK